MTKQGADFEASGHDADNPVFSILANGRALAFGDRALLYAFLQTVADQLEGGKAGARFPLLQSIVLGQIADEHYQGIHEEALRIQAELEPVVADDLPGIDGATWDWVDEDGDFISTLRVKIKDWLVSASEDNLHWKRGMYIGCPMGSRWSDTWAVFRLNRRGEVTPSD